MLRKSLFTTAALTAIVAATMIVSAQGPPGDGKVKEMEKVRATEKGKAARPPGQMIVKIKDGFYEVTGAGGNTSVRVTKDGLIVVDTKNLGEANYNDLMAQIKTVSNLPVKYVVITHVHQDHSGNTKSFEDAGAKVIANEGEKAELATYTAPAGKPAEPNVTYGKKTTIKLGGVKAEVYHFSRAHTGGDSVVYFPDLKIVAGGDAIVNGAPNIDFANGGSARRMAQADRQHAEARFRHADPRTRQRDDQGRCGRLQGQVGHAGLARRGAGQEGHAERQVARIDQDRRHRLECHRRPVDAARASGSVLRGAFQS